MFGIIRKLIFFGAIALALYVLFSENGLENVKKFTGKLNVLSPPGTETEETNKIEQEKKELKAKPWQNIDKKIPEDFDSEIIPDSKLKSTTKKIINKSGGGNYGYK